MLWVGLVRGAQPEVEPLQASPVRVPIPVPVGQPEPATGAKPPGPTEAEEPQTVRVALTTRPTGAQIFSGDGQLLCARAPCQVDVVPGEPLALRATLGSRKGKAKVTPKADETVLIKLGAAAKRVRRAEQKPQSKVRNQRGSTDLKVPEWAQ